MLTALPTEDHTDVDDALCDTRTFWYRTVAHARNPTRPKCYYDAELPCSARGSRDMRLPSISRGDIP